MLREKMKIGIIGYDLFGTGGTKRSNLNLINEFLKDGHHVTYFNLLPFTKKKEADIRAELNNNSLVHFSELKHFETAEACELYIITRESLLLFSKVIKNLHPTAIIVGEIHTPLQLIDPELDFSADFVDYYRVATKEILTQLSNLLPAEKLFHYPVSVTHLSFIKKQVQPIGKQKNFLIYSRFDEHQKDIVYAIRLMDYLIHYQNKRDYFLYLNGHGPYEKVYRQLIADYHLEKQVLINAAIPDETIYLSTARCETLGYSILEAFAEGKPLILYEGDDHSLRDIYGEFAGVCWLNKDVASDAASIEDFLNRTPNLQQQQYNHDVQAVKKIIQTENYAKNYLAQLQAPKTTKTFPVVSITEIFQQINRQNNLQNNGRLLSLYLRLKELPVIGSLLRSDKLKQTLKGLLSTKTTAPAEQSLLEGNLRDDFVFVETFHGKAFAGDSKYLALFLQEKLPHLHFFVSSANELTDTEILKYGMTPVRISSHFYVEKFRKSKWVLTNGNTLDKVGKVKQQVIIQSWHGLPLTEFPAAEKAAFIPRMKKWDYLLTSSKMSETILEQRLALKEHPNLQRLNIGMPRNAYLIANRDNQEEKCRIHWKYFNQPLQTETKFVLYCPKFQKNSLEIEKLLSQLPAHYQIITTSDYVATSQQTNRLFVYPSELADLQELFLLADVLVTAPSETMFDYAHLKRKIIVLQEDWLEETSGLAGKNYSPAELAHEILSETNTDYNQQLIHIFLQYDQINTNQVLLDLICEH